MHGRIIQLEAEPVNEDGRLREYDVPGWFYEDIADSVVRLQENVRGHELRSLKSEGFTVKGAGIGFDPDRYLRERYLRYRERLGSLIENCTFESFCGSDTKTRLEKASEACNDRFGIYIWHDGNLYTLSDFARFASLPGNRQMTYYTGSVLGYRRAEGKVN